MSGRKSNIKDAAWIATLLMKGLLTDRFVPQKNIRALRPTKQRNRPFVIRRKTLKNSTIINNKMNFCKQ
jgi:phosphopantetheine adenylyltransferase